MRRVYHFPELGIVELPSRDDDSAPLAPGHSVSQYLKLRSQKSARSVAARSVQRFRAELEEVNARAREEAMDREPPATIRGYRQVYGRDRGGWPGETRTER